MFEGKPLLGWALLSAAARFLGVALAASWTFVFARVWADATSTLAIFVQLGGMITLGCLQGALHALLTGQLLRQFLPEADLQVYVRNTSLFAGLQLVAIAIPIALASLAPESYASGAGSAHSLAIVGAFLIGPAQWWAFRQYPKAWWYIVASAVAHSLDVVLVSALQSSLLEVGFDSLLGVLIRALGASAIGFISAWPTGITLSRIARVNAAAG